MLVREILVVVFSVSLGMIWLALFVPLVSRLFGVLLPLAPWKRRSVRLTLGQSILLNGILSFAISLFITSITIDYLDWRLSAGLVAQPTAGHFIWDACGCLIGGVFVGWFIYPTNGSPPKPGAPLI
jgi:hypothetical protein